MHVLSPSVNYNCCLEDIKFIFKNRSFLIKSITLIIKKKCKLAFRQKKKNKDLENKLLATQWEKWINKSNQKKSSSDSTISCNETIVVKLCINNR